MKARKPTQVSKRKTARKTKVLFHPGTTRVLTSAIRDAISEDMKDMFTQLTALTGSLMRLTAEVERLHGLKTDPWPIKVAERLEALDTKLMTVMHSLSTIDRNVGVVAEQQRTCSRQADEVRRAVEAYNSGLKLLESQLGRLMEAQRKTEATLDTLTTVLSNVKARLDPPVPTIRARHHQPSWRARLARWLAGTTSTTVTTVTTVKKDNLS